MQLMNLLQQFVRSIKYCKKVMNKHFKKNLIMSEEEEHLFQQSNSCQICKKLIDNDDKKVRDHCYVTGKFRGAAHGSCKINLQLTKKVPVIFHNLRGYNSHFVFNELDIFDVKISVRQDIFLKLTLNILMNYMSYTMIIHQLQKNLLFLVICCQIIVKKMLISMRQKLVM